MSLSPYIIDAGRSNFEDAVLRNSEKGPVLVNYWAEGAGPCLRLWPVLQKLANDYAGKFLLVNICTDQDKQLAREYGVNSVPTVKLFVKGTVVGQIHGAESERSFKTMLDRYVARESEAELARAVSEYQQGQIDNAFGMLSKLVLTDPDNPRIQLSYAKLLIREQRYQDAFDLLDKTTLKNENEEAALLMANAYFLATARTAPDTETIRQILEKNPDDLSSWLQLCSYHMMHSEYREAMEALLLVYKKDRGFSNGIAGFCLRTIFTLLGDDNELVREFRQRVIES